MAKNDIRVNYEVLKEIDQKTQKFSQAIGQIKKSVAILQGYLTENEGETIDALRLLWENMQGDLNSVDTELQDIGSSIRAYKSDMTNIMPPVDYKQITRVSRYDIKANMTAIHNAVDSLPASDFKLRTHYTHETFGVPDYISKDKEEQRKLRENKRKMNEIEGIIREFEGKFSDEKRNMWYIYHNKVVPYEQTDDRHGKKAQKLYETYSSEGEKEIQRHTDLRRSSEKIVASFMPLAELFQFGANAQAIISDYENGKTPDTDKVKKFEQAVRDYEPTAKEILKNTQEIIKDPFRIVESTVQGFSDMYETYDGANIIVTDIIVIALLSYATSGITTPLKTYLQNVKRQFVKFLKKYAGKLGKKAKKGLKQLIDKLDNIINGVKNNFQFGDNVDNHLKNVEKIGKGGVSGGHNLVEFKKAISNLDSDLNLDDCIINQKAHPTKTGIYEIEYKIPIKDKAGNIKKPIKYKKEVFKKTVYDPKVITDTQIAKWGREAMQNGVVNQATGEVIGYASNGLKFIGYLDNNGTVKNFYPVLD